MAGPIKAYPHHPNPKPHFFCSTEFRNAIASLYLRHFLYINYSRFPLHSGINEVLIASPTLP
jgi:hypothetical protein